jgi:hypothetical protein
MKETTSTPAGVLGGVSAGQGWLAERLRDRYEPVLVILSPPRCGSTAVARSFWRHPVFGWYLHEPYDRVYHRGCGQTAVDRAVSRPAELKALTGGGCGDAAAANGLIVKEMTFQPGRMLPELMMAATLPLVITVRDPRLAIASRMRRRAESGQDPGFSPVESGWGDLAAGLAAARAHRIRYAVVEVTRLRAHPELVLPELCERIGLQFTPDMTSWPSLGDVPLGHLEEQRHWYARVLRSTGFERPDEVVPTLDAFPAGEMRAHVASCLGIYREILTDPFLVG